MTRLALLTTASAGLAQAAEPGHGLTKRPDGAAPPHVERFAPGEPRFQAGRPRVWCPAGRDQFTRGFEAEIDRDLGPSPGAPGVPRASGERCA